MISPPKACNTCKLSVCECAKPVGGAPPVFQWPKKVLAVDKALDCAQWRKFRATLQAYNPQCQRIVDGVRCCQAGKIAHHLVGRHTAPSRMYDPSNLVMVCREHHPSDSDGEPEGSENEYAPTRWKVGFEPMKEFPHPKFPKLAPGQVQITATGARVG